MDLLISFFWGLNYVANLKLNNSLFRFCHMVLQNISTVSYF